MPCNRTEFTAIDRDKTGHITEIWLFNYITTAANFAYVTFAFSKYRNLHFGLFESVFQLFPIFNQKKVKTDRRWSFNDENVIKTETSNFGVFTQGGLKNGKTIFEMKITYLDTGFPRYLRSIYFVILEH